METLAKLSPPSSGRMYPRRRLFRRLDRALRRPVVFITGPPGSGKTSLVTSYLSDRELPCLWYQLDAGDADLATFFFYLGVAAKKAAPRRRKPLPLFTPEYGLGAPTFALRYFEDLCSRLKPPYVLVFDNYQEIPSGSAIHDIIRTALSALPQGISAIIMSRSESPPPFAALEAGNRLLLIGWEELKLTSQESRGLARIEDLGKRHSEMYEWLHEKADGWAAGLVLLARALKTESIDPGAWIQAEPGKVFDFFANELFDRMDRPTQAFLLQTAFLPKITVGLAERLTGNRAAGRILSELNRRNTFTEKRVHPEVTYQYHALFREFLVARAESRFSAQKLSVLRIEAGNLLASAGHTEDAAALFIQAGAWRELKALVSAHAQALVRQGRNKLLDAWISAIPDERLESDPWLNFWMGTCRLPTDPAKSRALLERAFQLFVSSGDDAGALLAWSGAVQTFLYGFDDFRPLDPWIAWLDGRAGRGTPFPSPDIELSVAAGMTAALTWRLPSHPKMREWAEKALSLARNSANIEASTRAYTNNAVYQIWMGGFDECGLLIKDMERMVASQPVSPLRSIVLKHTEAMFYNTSAEFRKEAIHSVSEGLEEAQRTGVYVSNPLLYNQGVISALNQGDPERAEGFLARLEKTLRSGSRTHSGHYFYLCACHALQMGRLPQAVAAARKSLELLLETGTPVSEVLARLVLAMALHEGGGLEEARGELARAKQATVQTGSSYFEYLCLLAEAHFEHARGDEREGLESLRKAMALGRQRGFTTLLYFWLPSVMARLCGKALEAGIEAGYVRDLIRKLGLPPQEGALEIEGWPWPCRIHTLGRFEIERNGEALSFSGKTQQKPLQMLKAVVALGGKSVSKEQLTDLLWPDADGDLAHHSFETTLYRLRKVLGSEETLRFQSGRLSLDERHCWVDTRAFESALTRIEDLLRKQTDGHHAAEIERSSRRVVDLYRGHFLPGDTGEIWSASTRERLRGKFTRFVTNLGRYHQKEEEHERALAWFESGLEVDDLVEEFYQQLMVCHRRLGQEAKAVEIYHRCRSMLSRAFGIGPSSRTEEIYQSIRRP